MAITSTLVINGSVGRGGRNQRGDVRAVQTRLNELMSTPRQPLTVDGLNGPKTSGVIRDFQRAVVGMSWPDGRVDPGRGTHARLNDPHSADIWKGKTMTPLRSECPSAGAPVCAGAPAPASTSRPQSQGEQNARRLLDHAADDLNWSSAEYDAFAQAVLDNPDRSVGMAVLSVITTLNGAQDFLRGWEALRGAGCSHRDLVRAIMDRRHRGGNFNVIKNVGKKRGSVRYLRTFSTAADKILLVLVAMEVHDHLAHGRWGAAASVAYQTGMGMAVPWASFVGALQGIIGGLFPGTADSRFFRALSTMDPIGLGGVGVDSFITVAVVAIDALRSGQINMAELMALHERMKKSPAAFFTEMGDNMGQALYELRTTVRIGRDAGPLLRQVGRDLNSVRKFLIPI